MTHGYSENVLLWGDSFAAHYAAERGQEVLYVTERAVFRLEPRGVRLIEVAPGINLQRDLLPFMEFTPLSNIENVYKIDPAAQGCTTTNPTPANPCFHTLPGYSPTCVNGVDPAHANAPCNAINNLYQQTIEDLNKNNFAQYTPVLPQTAVAGDGAGCLGGAAL